MQTQYGSGVVQRTRLDYIAVIYVRTHRKSKGNKRLYCMAINAKFTSNPIIHNTAILAEKENPKKTSSYC
jgi:hypothetical protein